MEAHRLRVKDLVIERGELTVRDAKGGQDRVTVLAAAIIAPLREHLAKLHVRFERQRNLGEPGVSLPTALARKYPNAPTQWGWQWVFGMHIPAGRPATINTKGPCSGRSMSPYVRLGSCSRRAVISFVRRHGCKKSAGPIGLDAVLLAPKTALSSLVESQPASPADFSSVASRRARRAPTAPTASPPIP
jgi:hypothetical protein